MERSIGGGSRAAARVSCGLRFVETGSVGVGRALECALSQVGVRVDEDKVEKLVRYAFRLSDRGSKLGLTATRDPEEAAVKHLADALSLLLVEEVAKSQNLLDIGSGAGLPAVPLAVCLPEASVLAVDSRLKAVIFMEDIKRELGLHNFGVVRARIEQLAHEESLANGFKAVVARGVARLKKLLELAAPFVAEDGVLVAMKGDDVREELREAEKVMQKFGFVIREVFRYRVCASAGERSLVVISHQFA